MSRMPAVLGLVLGLAATISQAQAALLAPEAPGLAVPILIEADADATATSPTVDDMAAALDAAILAPATLIAARLSADDSPIGPVTTPVLVGVEAPPATDIPNDWPAASALDSAAATDGGTGSSWDITRIALAVPVLTIIALVLIKGRRRHMPLPAA